MSPYGETWTTFGIAVFVQIGMDTIKARLMQRWKGQGLMNKKRLAGLNQTNIAERVLKIGCLKMSHSIHKTKQKWSEGRLGIKSIIVGGVTTNELFFASLFMNNEWRVEIKL